MVEDADFVQLALAIATGHEWLRFQDVVLLFIKLNFRHQPEKNIAINLHFQEKNGQNQIYVDG